LIFLFHRAKPRILRGRFGATKSVDRENPFDPAKHFRRRPREPKRGADELQIARIGRQNYS